MEYVMLEVDFYLSLGRYIYTHGLNEELGI